MEPSQRSQRATSFGGVADVYERTRPGYPIDAVQWLVEQASRVRILELGAGTGKLTATLLAEGHRVTASDPEQAMLKRLRKSHQGTRVVQASAERIPVHSGAVDVVVAAQCFHWFDRELALPEIARVLRPGGTVALVWNDRDETVPWVRRLSKLLHEDVDEREDPVKVLEESGLFDGIQTETFRHWQPVDRDSLIGLVSSRSYVVTLAEPQRAQLLERVGELYDDYGRGHDGMLLPYLTRCYRAHVAAGLDTAPTPQRGRRTTGPTTGPSDGLDDDLLIDFN